jgi:hypothetical protein
MNKEYITTSCTQCPHYQPAGLFGGRCESPTPCNAEKSTPDIITLISLGELIELTGGLTA